MGKRLKRGKSIGNQQERALGIGHRLTDNGSRGALGQNVVDESVAIEPFAFDGKERSPGATVRESIDQPSMMVSPAAPERNRAPVAAWTCARESCMFRLIRSFCGRNRSRAGRAGPLRGRQTGWDRP